MIRATWLFYLVLTLIVPSASRCFATEPSPDLASRSRLPRTISYRSMSMYARARILVSNASRDEFDLSDSQAQQIDDLLREWSADEEESSLKQTSPRESNLARNTKKIEETQKYLQRLQKLLTAEQITQLDRLALQARGLSAIYNRGPVAEKMELSDEQLKQVRAIGRSASSESQMTQLLEILTPEQRKIWDELTGKNFVLSDRTRGRGRAVSLVIPTIGSPASSLRKPWVLRDLKLTAVQSGGIDAQFAAIAAHTMRLQEQIIAGAQAEARQDEVEKLRKSTDETSANLLAIISAQQRKRLDQLVLQSDGLLVLQRPDVHNRLDLSRQQITEINEFIIEFREFTTTERGKPRRELEEVLSKRKQLLKKSLLLLTPSQLKKWEEFVGPLADQSPVDDE